MNFQRMIGGFLLGIFLWGGIAFAEEGSIRLIGMGVVTSTMPYKDVGMKSTVVPLLVLDYKNFYIQGIEAGYHVYDRKPWRLSVVTSPRLMGYHSDDSSALNGMEDRLWSVDAGVKADYDLPFGKELFLTARVVTDVGSRSDGQEAELSLAKTFRGDFYQLIPSLGVHYQSQRLTDYYYGVKDNEMRVDRPSYEPGAAVNYYSDILLKFGISKNWIAVTRASVELLASEITKSPIVSRHEVLTGVIGLTRKF